MAQTAYSINCREADYKFLRTILIPEQINVEQLKIPELSRVDPPADLVFLGWEEVKLEEDQQFSTKEVVGIMLTKIREALSFRDVPVFVLAGRTHVKEAQVMLKLGANGILAAPLDRQEAISTIRTELSYAGTKSTIDARVVNPFAEGAMKVFESMAKTPAVREDILLKKDYRLLGDISAMIEISGERASGSVALTFETGLAWTLVGRMLGMQPRQLRPEDVYDGIGELTNMISGFAETALANEKILDLRQSVPKILTGRGHELVHHPGSPSLVITFRANGSRFAVQVALHQEPKSGPAWYHEDASKLAGGRG